MSPHHKDWERQDLADAIKELIRKEQRIGKDWEVFHDPSLDDDDPETHQIDKVYAEKVDALAKSLVNNRVTEPVRAIAYGNESDGRRFGPETQKHSHFDRTLIKNILSAESYPDFLGSRLLATFFVMMAGMGVFLFSSFLLQAHGMLGGLSGLLASAFVVLMWLAFRVVKERMGDGSANFFRHYGSLAPIRALEDALEFLDDELDDFVEEIEHFQNLCTPETDKLTNDFNDNAQWTARSLVAWAVARRAAQYISFQPTNVEEKYELNGMARMRMRRAAFFFLLAQGALIGAILVLALLSPLIFESIAPGSATVLGQVTLGPASIALWPTVSALFLTAVALVIGAQDRITYKKDRNRVALALGDFWRCGETRTAEAIANLEVPASVAFDDWHETAARHMLREEEAPDEPLSRDEREAAFEEWEKSRHWADKLVKTDPTVKLMRRLISALTTLEARQSVKNYSSDKTLPRLSSPRKVLLAAEENADGRPRRSRTLPPLGRRGIWHP